MGWTSAVLTELSHCRALAILPMCSSNRPLVDLSTNGVAE